VAEGIVAQYPTPLSLAQQYQREDLTTLAKEELLREIPIPNQSKQVGSSRSRKIFQIFSAEDPCTTLL
jgi:hypothetical protein